ncbi:EsaK (plasmid) [Burkholderia sp. FERM BP-3421]|uniref:EsaK n=1 Tax=Burkholderia sp. FERM BP-3421 TaxID=1494466 RepID=UPI0023624D72|nr:EsaK [Burkholderia sp. FERM BP-3421]WDD90572.1 EsaK [Burkholderia sp. FERM BP-3421]
MTDFPISITYLPGPAPVESLIPAATLAGYVDAASIVERAQAHAARVLEAARSTLADAERDAHRLREDAHRQGLADAAAELAYARENLIGETVRWLVDEADLEAQIAMHLDDRLRVLVASVVEPYLRDRDAVELLLAQVRTCLAGDQGASPLELQVSAASAERIRAALGDAPRVRVTVEAALRADEARLASPYAIVHFNPGLHLDLLLSRLLPAPSTARAPTPPNDDEPH